MTASTAIRPPPRPARDPRSMTVPGRSMDDQILVKIVVWVPFSALVAAVPNAWGRGLGWTDLGLAAGERLARITART